MASLNKLAIRGIRSFDDKELAVIEFFHPVTVIVGHNGSGKTTIIECLKYATTGDQPPNTRGGAFIHDPKMANEKEVKAQVRLRFVAANGQQMFVMRNLSVTVKKTGAMQMKTLEGVLGVSEQASNKVFLYVCQYDRVLISTAWYNLYKMRGNGYRDTPATGCIKSCSGKRHLLPSRRLILATCRARRVKEEVR
jgi:hypothetical protein